MFTEVFFNFQFFFRFCSILPVFHFSFSIFHRCNAIEIELKFDGHNGEMESCLDTVHGLLAIFEFIYGCHKITSDLVTSWFRIPLSWMKSSEWKLQDGSDSTDSEKSSIVWVCWNGIKRGERARERERKQVSFEICVTVCVQITIQIYIHEKSHSKFPAAIQQRG